MPRITENEAQNYSSSSNGEWFSLKNDRDVARVQFMINSYEDLDVFACHKVKIGDKERYVDCHRTYDEPIDKCPLCAAGIPVKPVRFVIMYQHDDGKVKIWERGKNFVSKIQSLCNRYSPLSQHVFEIERVGKAGSKDTRYEIYPMDKVEPVDLTDIERPELLGGLILQKSPEEMETYLQTGAFPSEDDNDSGSSYQAARRAPVGRTEDAGIVRRGAPVGETPNAPRGPVRGSRRAGVDNKEVF